MSEFLEQTGGIIVDSSSVLRGAHFKYFPFNLHLFVGGCDPRPAAPLAFYDARGLQLQYCSAQRENRLVGATQSHSFRRRVLIIVRKGGEGPAIPGTLTSLA